MKSSVLQILCVMDNEFQRVSTQNFFIGIVLHFIKQNFTHEHVRITFTKFKN